MFPFFIKQLADGSMVQQQFQNKNCCLTSQLSAENDVQKYGFIVGKAHPGDFSITVLSVGHICEDDNFATTVVTVCSWLGIQGIQ